jgi:hypothetical protein
VQNKLHAGIRLTLSDGFMDAISCKGNLYKYRTIYDPFGRPYFRKETRKNQFGFIVYCKPPQAIVGFLTPN